MTKRHRRTRTSLVVSVLTITISCTAISVAAQDRFQIGGFAWVRGSSAGDDPLLDEEELAVQLQAGLDWYASPRTRAHLHLLVRDDRSGSSNERLGVVEGFLETLFRPRGDLVRLRGGAFFLPTSREHVDALWETPYAITPSALNGWMGEELRPIGLDVDYTHGAVKLGGTLFGGNDAFGTLPAVRGWRLRNHVALIDETIVAGPEALSRISVDTDDRPGWSARARWSTSHLLAQYTFLDNRAGGTERGGVVPWRTRFHIATVEWTHDDWTIAAESGWGPTWIPGLERFTYTDLRASYLLVSRRFGHSRASLRAEEMAGGHDGDRLAITTAWLWRPFRRSRAALELTATDDDLRVMAELRTYFSIH